MVLPIKASGEPRDAEAAAVSIGISLHTGLPFIRDFPLQGISPYKGFPFAEAAGRPGKADVLKLCDFGTSTQLTLEKPRSMENIGTLSYTAPEASPAGQARQPGQPVSQAARQPGS